MSYPTIPRKYSECRPRGQRAIDRHLEGKCELPVRMKDGRINVLRVIVEHLLAGELYDDELYEILKEERKRLKV